jgi:hypothetical protein
MFRHFFPDGSKATRELSGKGMQTRSQLRQQNILGVIAQESGSKVPLFRSADLELYTRYYENTAYDHLKDWLTACSSDEHVPIRDRRPLIRYPYAKILSQRIAAKLVGQNTFPKFENKQDLNWEEYVRAIVANTFLRSHLKAPIQRAMAVGSGMIRFYMKEGAFVFESYNPNHCYPVFNADGSLQSVKIRYVYTDTKDKDSNGKPIRKWFQMVLDQAADTLFDNPPYKEDEEPVFEVVAEAEHGLGFVQAEWFRTTYDRQSPDGESLIADVTDFIDTLNYSLSQSEQAVSYNQDPQLILNGMLDDEVSNLVRSATKSWNLGREGDAKFLESGLSGVERAESLREKVRLNISDVTRLIMHDPEKVVGHAQSAKAMEVLFEAMVELIEEIRPMLEPSLVSLVTKLGLINYLMAKLGEPTPIMIPEGFVPESIALSCKWAKVFPMTMADLQAKAAVAGQITGATIASREWALEWMAQDLGVEDLEYEKARIAAQPVINPFGMF